MSEMHQTRSLDAVAEIIRRRKERKEYEKMMKKATIIILVGIISLIFWL